MYRDPTGAGVLVADKRQQGNVSCALDSDCELALVVRARAGDTAGDNLCALADVSAQYGDILIIYALHFINAERANFSSLAATMRTIRAFSAIRPFGSVGHLVLPP